jgi:hypothetical protein
MSVLPLSTVEGVDVIVVAVDNVTLLLMLECGAQAGG